MGSRDAKQFVYRYNGVESSEEVEVDYDGEVSVPMQNQIVTRKGKAWKAIAIMTQISTEVFSNPKMSLKEAKGRRSGFCPFGDEIDASSRGGGNVEIALHDLHSPIHSVSDLSSGAMALIGLRMMPAFP
jgi:hypothetical protein